MWEGQKKQNDSRASFMQKFMQKKAVRQSLSVTKKQESSCATL